MSPPADFTNPLQLLEEVIGRPIPDDGEEQGEDGQAHLEKPAGLIEDVEFRGRSIQDFLEDEDECFSNSSLDAYGDTAQSVMECEYVCSYNVANNWTLNTCFRRTRQGQI